jgi:hypothetical protein
MQESKAIGFGDLSVHEVATHPTASRKLYSAYRCGLPSLQDQGHWVRSGRSALLRGSRRVSRPTGNNLWGVEMWRHPASGELCVLASDRDSGLWIFQDKTG